MNLVAADVRRLKSNLPNFKWSLLTSAATIQGLNARIFDWENSHPEPLLQGTEGNAGVPFILSVKGMISDACERFHKLARAMLSKIQGRFTTAKVAVGRLKIEGSRK